MSTAIQIAKNAKETTFVFDLDVEGMNSDDKEVIFVLNTVEDIGFNMSIPCIKDGKRWVLTIPKLNKTLKKESYPFYIIVKFDGYSVNCMNGEVKLADKIEVPEAEVTNIKDKKDADLDKKVAELKKKEDDNKTATNPKKKESTNEKEKVDDEKVEVKNKPVKEIELPKEVSSEKVKESLKNINFDDIKKKVFNKANPSIKDAKAQAILRDLKNKKNTTRIIE